MSEVNKKGSIVTRVFYLQLTIISLQPLTKYFIKCLIKLERGNTQQKRFYTGIEILGFAFWK